MDEELAQLDVPLLVALTTLLETASVTAAARTLGRTQSSMSRTLARLRTVFGDPLLVSAGRTLRLTPRAQELRPAVAQALEERYGVKGSTGFVPHEVELPIDHAAPGLDLCPSCGNASFVHEEGCMTCHACGYSEC